MVEELQSGPCIVMEIKHKDEKFDVQAEFRKLCGPMDPVSIRNEIFVFFVWCIFYIGYCTTSEARYSSSKIWQN